MTKRQGISPKLPLSYDLEDGPYRLNKTLGEAIKQNYKNIILTSPGERVMMPHFGVGLYNYLFENMDGDTFDDLASKIQEQTRLYAPDVNLISVDFITSDEDRNLSLNEVQVIIKYNTIPYGEEDELVISSNTTI